MILDSYILCNFAKKSENIMKIIIITILLLAIGFAGIAIKIWAKKGGEFAGTCASQNPHLNKSGEPCGFCGKNANEYRKSDCSN